jgi:phospholipid-binding lipoprotein MlaA
MKIKSWILIVTVFALGSTQVQRSCLAESLTPPGTFISSAPPDKEVLQVAIVNIPPPVEPKPEKPEEPEEPTETIADPFEPMNRVAFDFNDRLYFWVLKPVASGYNAIFPQEMRVCVRNFFSNLRTPINVVNCLLQANFKCAGNESARLLLNTTLGFFGCVDQAKKDFGIEKQEEDLGQTFGVWGIGPGFYINWPILGPYSLRDTVGYVGDLFVDPLNYLVPSFLPNFPSFLPNFAVRAYYQVNETSLSLGEYEDFKKAAIDPYIALKDAYYQYRKNKIKER